MVRPEVMGRPPVQNREISIGTHPDDPGTSEFSRSLTTASQELQRTPVGSENLHIGFVHHQNITLDVDPHPLRRGSGKDVLFADVFGPEGQFEGNDIGQGLIAATNPTVARAAAIWMPKRGSPWRLLPSSSASSVSPV